MCIPHPSGVGLALNLLSKLDCPDMTRGSSFLMRLVLPHLARMFNGQQQTMFLTQEYQESGLKSLDGGPPG